MATLHCLPISNNVYFPTTRTTTPTPYYYPPLLLLCGRYELLKEVSRGSFGAVHKGRDRKTGQIVAVKRIFDGSSIETQREINILANLPRHPSIVEFFDCPIDEWRGAYVVMEYLETDLRRFMRTRAAAGLGLSLSEVKRLMRQLLEGVELLHESGVMHRDLKPANILVDQSKGQLKIGDFGLSRFFDLRRPTVQGDSPRVGTLWYKAPELLLGAHEHSCAIDMWAVGCIMAELLLLNNRPLFQGTCEFSQLVSIYTVLGSAGFPSGLPRSGEFLRRINYHVRPYNLLASKFFLLSATSLHCLDLITKMLKYDPNHRITAKEALQHPWFNEFPFTA